MHWVEYHCDWFWFFEMDFDRSVAFVVCLNESHKFIIIVNVVTTSSSWMIVSKLLMACLWYTLLSQSVFNTKLLPGDPEQRWLLTWIDTLEFSKWHYKTIDQITSCYDIFDVPWTCFACRSMAAKHTDFCHSLRSYRKCKNDRSNGDNWNISVDKYMSSNALFNLMVDEKILEKNRNHSCDIQRTTVIPWFLTGWT